MQDHYLSSLTANCDTFRLPWLWSLVVGYDEDAGTYTVRHKHAGEITIGWDEFGHVDPNNYFCVMVVRPPEEPVDWLAANRGVLERALEASQGKYPGVQAPASGFAATRCGSTASTRAQCRLMPWCTTPTT